MNSEEQYANALKAGTAEERQAALQAAMQAEAARRPNPDWRTHPETEWEAIEAAAQREEMRRDDIYDEDPD